jgi:hypothetical protein
MERGGLHWWKGVVSLKGRMDPLPDLTRELENFHWNGVPLGHPTNSLELLL